MSSIMSDFVLCAHCRNSVDFCDVGRFCHHCGEKAKFVVGNVEPPATKTTIADCIAYANSIRSSAALRDCTYEIKSPKGYWLTYDGSGDRIKSGDDAEIVDEKDSPVSPPSKDTLTGCPYPPGSRERLDFLRDLYNDRLLPNVFTDNYEGGVEEMGVSPFGVDLESALCRILGGDAETDDTVTLPTMSEDFAKWSTRS